MPYDPDFAPPAKPDPKRQVPVSRRNFVELCRELTHIDEKAFEDLWRRVGLSVNWDGLYTTISDDSVRVSQLAFLRNLARGEAYLSEAPTMWDVTFQTAVAQAELEARDYPGAYHQVAFHRADGGQAIIETTRPELIAACVALIAHPDDERYADLVGQTVTSPVFGVELPVVTHELAEPDKGSGLVMCCTFGDLTDVTWWRELQLPARVIIGRDGRILRDQPDWIADARPVGQLAGKTTFSARELMVSWLRESGDLLADPTPTQRKANFYEKGDKPLEIVSTRQWYIRNGGRDADLKAAMLARGEELGLGAGAHAVPLRELGGRPERRLAHLPAAVLRRAVPGLVPAGRRRRAALRRRRSLPTEAELPIDPASSAAGRLHRGPTRRAGRLHGRPGRDGHLGHVVADPADRLRLGAGSGAVRAHLPDGPGTAVARHHPHLAVRPRGAGALRERLAALGPGRSSPGS